MHKTLAVGIAIFSAMLAHSAFAADVRSDAELRQLLIGYWTAAPDSPNKYDAAAIAQNWHALEQYAADGTGRVLVYKGAMCDTPDSSWKFAWKVVGGVVLSKRGKDVDHDKIIALNEKRAVLFSYEHKITEFRNRSAPCPLS
jgi:phage major head subunit gpT-like protein